MSCVYFQLQKKMSMIHQEVQSLRHRLDARKYDTGDDDRRLMTRMEGLKEQFRELLVEMRKRKAAESELAMSFCDEDSAVRSVTYCALGRVYITRELVCVRIRAWVHKCVRACLRAYVSTCVCAFHMDYCQSINDTAIQWLSVWILMRHISISLFDCCLSLH